MAVVAVGIDLVTVSDFAEQLAQPGSVAYRSFTLEERRYCTSSEDPDRHWAARWAAKEAVFKAWSSTRIGQSAAVERFDYHEVEVLTDVLGRPWVRLRGKIDDELRGATVMVSLTHDGNTAAAVAIIDRATDS